MAKVAWRASSRTFDHKININNLCIIISYYDDDDGNLKGVFAKNERGKCDKKSAFDCY